MTAVKNDAICPSMINIPPFLLSLRRQEIDPHDVALYAFLLPSHTSTSPHRVHILSLPLQFFHRDICSSRAFSRCVGTFGLRRSIMTSGGHVIPDPFIDEAKNAISCFACDTQHFRKPSLPITLTSQKVAQHASVQTKEAPNPFTALLDGKTNVHNAVVNLCTYCRSKSSG